MIDPMLAETAKPFDSPDWLFEQKLDGVRCIATLDGSTKLQARSGADITNKFPELASLHAQADKPCILDGELVCDTFHQMQERIHREKALAIRIASRQNPATFYVFDIMALGGESLMARPLIDRKLALARTFRSDTRGRILGWQTGDGVALFERYASLGLEGVMAKRMASTYQGKRSPDWLKIKSFKEDRFLVCGITEGEGDRATTFGSLVLARETPGGLAYAGNVGSGFSEATLRSLLPVLEALKGDCPFPKPPDMGRQLRSWLRPFLWCEVRYFQETEDGLLRFPTFRRLASGC